MNKKNKTSTRDRIMITEATCLKRSNASGDSELIIAGRSGDVDRIRGMFHELTTDLGYSIKDARTVFAHHANRYGKTVLHEAAQNSRDECVRYLVQKRNDGGEVEMDPDCLKQGDWTPLMLACTKGSLKVIRTLVEADASMNLRNKDGWTPFHIACREGHEEIIAYFLNLESLALWQTASRNGRTPLHTVALYGREPVVRLLLSKKAYSEIDIVDSCGSTPLMDALRGGHIEIAECLIKAGADPYKRDAVGRQPIHLAAQAGRDDSIRFLAKLSSNEQFEDPSAPSVVNISTSDESRSMPAHFAAKEGHVSTLTLLKTFGACLDSKDSRGRTPLHLAASSQNVQCVEYLLCEGVQDSPDEQGIRPSQLAHKDNVKRLFDNL